MVGRGRAAARVRAARDDRSLDALVAPAVDGDRAAMEELVRRLSEPMYRLALRMTGHPADAEDAAQEILIRIVTRLASFRGESAFSTWCYRVAANHLLSQARRPAEEAVGDFDRFGSVIDAGVATFDVRQPEQPVDRVLAEDVRLQCTEGMLLCLDRGQRLAFVLDEIIGLDSVEGAAVLGITRAAFRKRVSRARGRLARFMQGRCGVLDDRNPCSCGRQIPYATDTGMLDPGAPLLASLPRRDGGPVGELRGLLTVGAVMRNTPEYVAPDRLVDALRAALGSRAEH